MKSFNIDPHKEVTDYGLSTMPIEAHKGLDQILIHMRTQNLSGGGEIWLTENDTNRTYRLTFCEATDLTICPHCHGTGLQKNSKN